MGKYQSFDVLSSVRVVEGIPPNVVGMIGPGPVPGQIAVMIADLSTGRVVADVVALPDVHFEFSGDSIIGRFKTEQQGNDREI